MTKYCFPSFTSLIWVVALPTHCTSNVFLLHKCECIQNRAIPSARLYIRACGRECASACAPAHARGTLTPHRPGASDNANCQPTRMAGAHDNTRVENRPTRRVGRLATSVGRIVLHGRGTAQLHQKIRNVGRCDWPAWRTVAQNHWPTRSVGQCYCKGGRNYTYFETILFFCEVFPGQLSMQLLLTSRGPTVLG